MAVLDAHRAFEADPGTAHDAGDVRAAVEHGGQGAGPVRYLAGQHRVTFHRPDLYHPDAALDGDPARLGQRADRRDAGGWLVGRLARLRRNPAVGPARPSLL